MTQEIEQLLLRGAALTKLELKGFGSARWDEIGRTERLKWHEKYTIGVVRSLFCGCFERKAGFPDASGTDQREQAAVRVSKEISDFAEFACPADKRRGLRWKVTNGHRNVPRESTCGLLYTEISDGFGFQRA
jgi:hypothetical protein